MEELIIVGSGPAGYTAAIYAARAGLEPLVIAGSVTEGGSLMNTTDVENFPGFPEGIQGPDLMVSMRTQAERFGAKVLYDDVVETNLQGAVKTVKLGSGSSYDSRSVILAMGSAYRKLGLPDEERLSGHGVSWCATCDGFFFKGKDVAVVGGGDSALEEALFLSRFASSVTIIHRRESFRASKIMSSRALAEPKIRVLWNSEVSEILGESALEGLMVKTDAGVLNLVVSGLFIAIGHEPRSLLVEDQVLLDAAGYVLTDFPGKPKTETSVPGVFACGDLVDDTYRQAITAAGSGAMAALDAQHFL